MKQQLIAFYLDWVNNYLGPHSMASAYGITVEQCNTLLEIGRELHEVHCQEMKNSK